MKIVKKLTLVFFILILLVSLIIYSIESYTQNKNIEITIQNKAKEMATSFHRHQDLDTNKLSSTLDAIISNRDFKVIYMENNREALYNYGQPLFQELKSKYNMTHMYFILPNGTVFLRMHGKDLYGDKVERFTFQKARDTNELASGVELGKTAFALRVVTPYYNGSELIGYVELGEEIDHFLTSMKDDTKNEFAISIDKKYLDRENWKSVRKVAGLRDNWDDMKDSVVISYTENIESFYCISNEYREQLKKVYFINYDSVKIMNRTFVCRSFEIIDAGGRHAGNVITLIDTTSYMNNIQELNYMMFYMLAAVFVLVIIAGILISRLISRNIIKLRNSVIDVSKNNMDVKIDINSKDELGELANAFNQMTKNLKASQEQIKRHASELEQKVHERTSELDEKVKELTDTKNAVLNMMEDMESTNTELVGMQRELKESLVKLKEMDIKKDEFISIAAHELKTPLTSIHGFSQLLQNKDVASDPAKRDKFLKIMDHETKRLAKLVGEILDLSRIDLGTIKLAVEEVDINKFMDDVGKEMDIQIKQKGLASEYEIEKNLPKITTDREKLTEVLLNLIINAVKYTPKGKISVKVFRKKDLVYFVVKDTGIGIAKEYYDKLFHRFYQIDSSYTRKAGGTGLGLALCKEFVTLLGGKIGVISEPGKGSEFYFYLPVKGAPKKQIREEEKKARNVLKKSENVRKGAKKIGIGK